MAMSQEAASTAIDTISKTAEYAGDIIKASTTMIKATTEAITAAAAADLVSVSEIISSETEEIKNSAIDLMEKVCDQTSAALTLKPSYEVNDPPSTPSTLVEAETKFLTTLSKIHASSIHASSAHAVAQSFINSDITEGSLPDDLVAAFKYMIEVTKVTSNAFAASAAAVKAIYSTATTAAVLYPMDTCWVAAEFAVEENDDEEEDPALFWTDPTFAGADDEFEDVDDDEGIDGDGDDMDG